MTLLFRVLKKNRLFITITTISFLLAGFLISTFAISPVYQAKALLMVTSTEDPAVAKLDYMTVLANKQLVKTYCEIIPSMSVLRVVASHLNFNVTKEELKRAIAVNQVNDTELMEIVVSYKNPLQAAEIANSTADVFGSQMQSVFPLAQVKLVDPAIENRTPVRPKTLLNTVAATLVGLVSAVFWCLGTAYLKQTRGENCN